jgi:hypothetical protein
MPRRPAVLLATTLIALTAAADDEPKRPTAYRVTVDGNMKITTSLGPTVVRRTQAQYDYRMLRREGGVDVALDRFGLRVLANGQEMEFVDMSRSRAVVRRAALDLDVRREDAPPRLLRMFEQFDPPLAQIQLNADGSEASRKTKDADGPAVEARALDLARLFHPRFPEDESKWEAPVVMAFGRFQHSTGALRYTKQKPDEKSKNSLVQVDVTGFLKVEGKHDLAEIQRGAYKVAGRQTYDPATKDWVAGRLVVTAGFEAVMPSGITIKADGPVTYTLTRRDTTAKTVKGKKKAS